VPAVRVDTILMDGLTNSIVAMKHQQTMSQVQFAVARKVLDNQQLQGDAAVKLIQAAAKTGAGAGDALVAAATGLGGELDAYA
jgi:hypothetical protein